MITFARHHKTDSSICSFGVKNVGPFYWVGTCKNGAEYYAGQSFKVPQTGTLTTIKLFSSVVHGDTEARLQVYDFDYTNYSWLEKKAEAVKQVTKSMENGWLSFDLADTFVLKEQTLGFKLSCTGGMLAIAECSWSEPDPYREGVEWVASSHYPSGRFQKDFAFAFEAEIKVLTDAQFI